MSKSQRDIPKQLLFLDFVGMLFIAIGLAEYFAKVNWLPSSLRFNYFEFTFIFVGFLMTLPMVIWFFKNALIQKK
jgi:hypothetical protein